MITSENWENSCKGKWALESNVCNKKVPVTNAANLPAGADAFRVET